VSSKFQSQCSSRTAVLYCCIIRDSLPLASTGWQPPCVTSGLLAVATFVTFGTNGCVRLCLVFSYAAVKVSTLFASLATAPWADSQTDLKCRLDATLLIKDPSKNTWIEVVQNWIKPGPKRRVAYTEKGPREGGSEDVRNATLVHTCV
jgi:hypothetical protein